MAHAARTGAGVWAAAAPTEPLPGLQMAACLLGPHAAFSGTVHSGTDTRRQRKGRGAGGLPCPLLSSRGHQSCWLRRPPRGLSSPSVPPGSHLRCGPTGLWPRHLNWGQRGRGSARGRKEWGQPGLCGPPSVLHDHNDQSPITPRLTDEANDAMFLVTDFSTRISSSRIPLPGTQRGILKWALPVLILRGALEAVVGPSGVWRLTLTPLGLVHMRGDWGAGDD